MKEIREILADLPVEIYSMKEAGISVEIDENGKTFEENAKIKAQTVAGCTDGGTIVLAVWVLLANLPFILIQRYNRPRLMRLAALLRKRAQRKGEQNARTDPDL